MIIYLDEINFTKASILQRDWSRKNSNLTVDNINLLVGYKAVIASMTEENGMDHIATFDRAINQEDFKNYLKKLSAKHKKRPLALFMDQLPVHRANSMYEEY